MASLTRKFLTSLGIEDDKAEQIFERHSEVLAEIKDERDKFKIDAEKLPEIQKQLDELKEKQETNGDEALAQLQEKYDSLEKEYKEYKSGISAKETKAKKEAAKKELLKEAGVADKYIDLIMKASSEDVDGYEFGEDGKTVKDAEKKIESYKKDFADFITVKKQVGADQNNPPASNGGASAPTRAAELFKKHTAEMYGTKS